MGSTHLDSATSSLESVAGHSPCDGQDGRKIILSGPGVVPARHSHRRLLRSPSQSTESDDANGAEAESLDLSTGRIPSSNGSGASGVDGTILDTSGLNSCDSSRYAGRRLSLASRLAVRLAANGTPEYTLIWKRSAIESLVTSRGIMNFTTCRLRASARRTSDSGYSGWVSPTARDHSRGVRPPRPQDTGVPLSQQVGMIVESSPAETSTSKGETNSAVSPALNPAFSRWLMGYPASWDRLSPSWDKWDFAQQELTESADCGDTETR